MVQRTAQALAELYTADETAWLDATAELIRRGQFNDIDSPTLAEFLTDMARRDRREVTSRLSLLLAHFLKWQYQPDCRIGSWQATIEVQRQELRELLESATLRRHAEEVLPKAYENALQQAMAETGLPRETFPSELPFVIDALLAQTLST